MAYPASARVVVGPLRDLVAAFSPPNDYKAGYEALLEHAESAGPPGSRQDIDQGLTALGVADGHFDSGDLDHYAADWLGSGWFGNSGVADTLYEGLVLAARTGLDRDLPLDAVWVPVAAGGQTTASVVESPNSVTLVVVTPPPDAAGSGGSDPEVQTVP